MNEITAATKVIYILIYISLNWGCKPNITVKCYNRSCFMQVFFLCRFPKLWGYPQSSSHDEALGDSPWLDWHRIWHGLISGMNIKRITCWLLIQWITGWWYTYPSEKIWKSVGMMTFPIYGKIKNVPNHQPDNNACWLWIRTSNTLVESLLTCHFFIFSSNTLGDSIT